MPTKPDTITADAKHPKKTNKNSPDSPRPKRKKKSAKANPQALSDLPDADVDLHALLAEPIPPDEDEPKQRELFIKRQYRGEQLSGRMNALFRWRMGVVLLKLKAETRHGEWESYVLQTFPFSVRSASTFMAIARQATAEEASQHSPFDLMVKLGLAKPSNDSPSEVIDKAALELKSIWKSVMKNSEKI